ncbi:MAG: hypothetical protein LC660_03400 [Desulfobacteraceae bacterium]|nr:hypothetical protein [Desulfobacteraceae bacterium]
MSGKKGKIDQIGSDYGRTNPAILPVWSVCGGELLECFTFPSRTDQAVPRIYSVLPEIIDNSPTFHYSRPHYGNANFNNYGLYLVAVTGQKASPGEPCPASAACNYETQEQTAEDQTQGPDFLGDFIQVLERLEECSHCCEAGNSNQLTEKDSSCFGRINHGKKGRDGLQLILKPVNLSKKWQGQTLSGVLHAYTENY